MCQFRDTCTKGATCNREPVRMELDADGYMVGRYCEHYRENEVMFDISHSGLNKYMARCELSNYITESTVQKEAKALVESYVDHMRKAVTNGTEVPWLLLSGHCGLGKTHLATAVFKEAIRAGLSAKPMYYVEDIQSLKNCYYGKSNDDLLGELKNVPFLFLDEFLKTYTNADMPIVVDLINFRYNNCLPTIITTELPPNEIMTKLTSTMDRILEKTQKKYIYFFDENCQSYRLKHESSFLLNL